MILCLFKISTNEIGQLSTYPLETVCPLRGNEVHGVKDCGRVQTKYVDKIHSILASNHCDITEIITSEILNATI
jgi:hypothetical protein